jgi:REP element-mobilizing transposase RayT
MSAPTDDDLAFFDPYAEVEVHTRNLPHWRQTDVWYFVTFRLADSLPEGVTEQITADRERWRKNHHARQLTPDELREYHRLFTQRVEDLLHNGYGACWLKDPKIAALVEAALHHFNHQHYELGEYKIMPNHVHLLVKPIGKYTLAEILHSWKSFTAHQINKIIGNHGEVWRHESYDRIVRDDRALAAIVRYIQNNGATAT